MLAIGGWAFGSTPFKELTSNVYRMNQFVYEAIEFLREYKFNGLDVDWEYPRGAEDKAAYVNLLRELRVAFEGEAKTSGLPRLLLTAAVPASFEAIAGTHTSITIHPHTHAIFAKVNINEMQFVRHSLDSRL